MTDCFVANIEMEVHVCPCGISWAAPKSFFDKRREDHKTFYCPNGCPRHYPQESKEEKLKRQLREKSTRLQEEIQCCIEAREEANRLERKAWGYKGYATKLKKKMTA